MLDKIGDLLLEADHITQAQLTSALDYQEKLGGKLGTILVKLGFVKEKELLDFLAQQLRLPLARDEDLKADEELLGLLPREFLSRHEVLPVRRDEDLLVVATPDPTDYPVIDEITFLTNLKVEAIIAPRARVQSVLQGYLARAPGAPEARPARPRDAGAAKAAVREVERQVLRSAQAASLNTVPANHLARALCSLLIDKGVLRAEEVLARATQQEKK